MFDDELIFPPIDYPLKVLDCGYGAGCWAVDVAETYEDCEVGAEATKSLFVGLDHRLDYWSRHITTSEANGHTREFLATGTLSAKHHAEDCCPRMHDKVDRRSRAKLESS